MKLLDLTPLHTPFTSESRAADRFSKILHCTSSTVTLLVLPVSSYSQGLSTAKRLGKKFLTQHVSSFPETAGMCIYSPETWGTYWLAYHIHSHSFPLNGGMYCGSTHFNN